MNRLEKLKEQYFELAHAVQSGVMYEIEFDDASVQPKHLRVAVNLSVCSHTALVRLLISKGLITEAEYFTYLVRELRDEVDRYRQRIADHHGVSIDKIRLM